MGSLFIFYATISKVTQIFKLTDKKVLDEVRVYGRCISSRDEEKDNQSSIIYHLRKIATF